jgi:hypothetical protein
MEYDRVLALIKFGKRKYIEEFINNGIIYMNPLSYFKSLEHDKPRSDKHEGASYCMPANGSTLLIDGVPMATIAGSIIFKNEALTNVFCMYAFRESASRSLIDPDNFEFGDTFAALLDGDEFLRRVLEVANREKMQIKYELVEYVNKETYKGEMGIFRKFSEFAYQSEFRISIVTGKDAPYILRIGDISDITKIGPLIELNKRIKIEINEGHPTRG